MKYMLITLLLFSNVAGASLNDCVECIEVENYSLRLIESTTQKMHYTQDPLEISRLEGRLDILFELFNFFHTPVGEEAFL